MSSEITEAVLSSCPVPIAHVDWRRLALTPQDGFILSRIDGATSAALLAHMSGLSQSDVLVVLERLVAIGAIDWAASKSSRASSAGVVISSAPQGVDPPSRSAQGDDSDESVELSPYERRLIVSFDARLDHLTHWDCLELGGSPTAADIKRAYFSQSRRFHPDRYFGKRLGSYGPRLDRIFKAIKTAYEVLADADSRARYQAQHPVPPTRFLLDPDAESRVSDAVK